MKYRTKFLVSVVLTAVLLLSFSETAPAMEKAQPQTLETSEELIDYMLLQLGDRESFISITIPDNMPESKESGMELIRGVLRSDSGFIRNGYSGGSAKITKYAGTTTYEFELKYHSTKKQDDAARRLASVMVSKWKLENLTDREKVDKLRSYISKYWRYDVSLSNITAYSALTTGKATCLGFVMACALQLDAMDIQYQTVHGRFSGIDARHVMLLVKLGDWWYTFDPSDIARERPVESSYLKRNYRKLFTPEAEYLTDSFHSAHPMEEIGS